MTKKQIEKYRKKWLAQLRHPDAMKARTELENYEDPRQRCCLGHACHALGIKRKERMTEFTLDGPTNTNVVFYDESTTYLPAKARKKLNLTYNGEFRKPIKVSSSLAKYWEETELFKAEFSNLAALNDLTPLGPNEIADVIEENFENDNFRPCDD